MPTLADARLALTFVHGCAVTGPVALKLILSQVQGVQEKRCVFSQFTATPPSPTSLLLETLKALNTVRVYGHSYWLVILCTTNSSQVLAREHTIFNEHPVGQL